MLLSIHYFISEAKYELYFMTTVLAIQIFLSVKSMSKCSSNYNLSPTAASVLVLCSYLSGDPPSQPHPFSFFSANPGGPYPSSSLLVWPHVGLGQRKISPGE